MLHTGRAGRAPPPVRTGDARGPAWRSPITDEHERLKHEVPVSGVWSLVYGRARVSSDSSVALMTDLKTLSSDLLHYSRSFAGERDGDISSYRLL